MQMRLLQITPYDVFPPIDGASSRSHGLVSAFPDNGDEVVRFCQRGPISRVYKLFQNGKQFESERLSRCLDITEGYREIRSQSILDDLMSIPGLFDYPQVLIGDVLDTPLSQDLNQYIQWSDILMVEKPWQFSALERVCEDVPIIYSSHDVVTELYSKVREKRLGKWFYNRVAELERNAVLSAEIILCTSERDKQIINQSYAPDSPIIVAPNAIERESMYTETEDHNLRTSLDIPDRVKVGLFIGGAHQPNVDAVHTIIEIAENFDSSSVCFLIVGSAGNVLDSLPDNVVTTGYVDNLDPYFDIADFGLNPIEWGGGTNIKMLDYFAHALPVISTDFGTRGFDLTHTEQVLIQPVSEFPEAIQMLIENPNVRHDVGKNAQEFVRNGYIWEEVSQSVREEIEKYMYSDT